MGKKMMWCGHGMATSVSNTYVGAVHYCKCWIMTQQNHDVNMLGEWRERKGKRGSV